MSPRALVYAAMAAVLLAVPGAAAAQTVTAIRYSPQNGDGSIAAASPVVITCESNKGMSGFSTGGTLTVSGGTLPGGLTSIPITYTQVGATLYATATVNWTTPATTGPASVTCTANATFGAPSTLTSTVAVAAPVVASPVFSAFTAPTGTVFAGTSHPVSALAGPIGTIASYRWTANGGTFADPTAASTTWTAPSGNGAFTLTVTATNISGGSTSLSSAVTSVLSIFQGGLPVAMRSPRRVAATADGDLLVVDGAGALFLMTKAGGLRSSVSGLGATAVAVGGGVAYVATASRGILEIDPATGRQVGSIPWGLSSAISGMAFDAARQLLWVAARDSNEAVAFRADGTQAFTVNQAEGRGLGTLSDVAVDAATNTLWIAEVGGINGNRVHVFNAVDATYLRSMVAPGASLGQVVETGGIALGSDGRIYVSDAFAGTVQVLTSTGATVGTIGSAGDGDPYLLQPRGLAFMANGDLAVANTGLNKVVRFGTGAALPTCAGDSDCDGLPDAWELAHGLNPNDPSDALGDPDGDGLNNREEFALGTDPKKADTDGDGYSDRAEMLAGFDPLNPNDHRPQLAVGGPVEVPPGLVSISATASGPVACAAAWRQLSGAAVTLRNAATFAPSFIARKAGSYRFEGIATCGTASSAPAVAEVKVLNVAPIADAGVDVVTSPGRTVTLSGSFSSDANGDALTYTWRQVKPDPATGPSAVLSARGSSLTVRPPEAGYYAFELTARDAAGLEGKDTLGVVVVKDGLPTAIVAEPLVMATVGLPVMLNASESLPQGVAFAWRQEGSGEVLGTAETLTFTPAAAGRYVIEVAVANGALISPPARVVVLASSATLPAAVASAPSTGSVNAALTLDGTASTGTALTYQWRQVAGPAAGLSDAFSAAPTVVPFATGAFAFELTVADASGAVSAPAVVRFAAVAPGKVLPVASATAQADAQVGELVILNGSASTGCTRYRWTQVAGPWGTLEGFNGTGTLEGFDGTAVFRPPAAGAYQFKLVVDDGTVQSAPATVTVNVQ